MTNRLMQYGVMMWKRMNLRLGLSDSENTGIEPRRLQIIGGIMKQKQYGFIRRHIVFEASILRRRGSNSSRTGGSLRRM